MRDQIPELVKKCLFLSDKVREQVLNNYKILPEEKIVNLINLLEKGHEKQQEVLNDINKKEGDLKRVNQKESLDKLKKDEELSRKAEEIELLAIEDELKSIL